MISLTAFDRPRTWRKEPAISPVTFVVDLGGFDYILMIQPTTDSLVVVLAFPIAVECGLAQDV